jgi:hypothetical protein
MKKSPLKAVTIAVAKKTLNRALAELHQAKDEEDVRQAAEKAWRAAREAVYAVIAVVEEQPRESTLSPSTVGAFEARYFGRTRGRFRLSPLYAFAMKTLHGLCFYENECPRRAEIEDDMGAVQELIELAEQDIATLTRPSRSGKRR